MRLRRRVEACVMPWGRERRFGAAANRERALMAEIYFDNAASTKVDPRVLEAMLPYFCEVYANPSALHGPAQRAKGAIEEARESVAELLGASDTSEVIFTGCATEANNAVLHTFDGR